MNSFSSRGEDGIVSSLKALYQSMMEQVAELIMVTSHLHARRPKGIELEKDIQAIFEQVARIDQSGARMRLSLKELERLLAQSSSAGEKLTGESGLASGPSKRRPSQQRFTRHALCPTSPESPARKRRFSRAG